MTSILPAQVRGARAMLGWSLVDLAKAARGSVSSVRRFESGGPFLVSEVSFEAMRLALEAAGIEFVSDPFGAPGLRVVARPA